MLESSPATNVESLQLLWLAEAEHLLGAATLQLAFAALGTTRNPPQRSSPSQTPAAVTPLPAKEKTLPVSAQTVAEHSLMSAGGRRPWGFGSGPFAEISATASDVFGSDGDGGKTGREEGGCSLEEEELVVKQLEVGLSPTVWFALCKQSQRGFSMIRVTIIANFPVALEMKLLPKV